MLFVTDIAIDWKVLINMYHFPSKTHFYLVLQTAFWSCVFLYINIQWCCGWSCQCSQYLCHVPCCPAEQGLWKVSWCAGEEGEDSKGEMIALLSAQGCLKGCCWIRAANSRAAGSLRSLVCWVACDYKTLAGAKENKPAKAKIPGEARGTAHLFGAHPCIT